MTHTPTEIMTVAAARLLTSSDVCFVGIGAPSAACNLARLTHAPKITLIYESGTLSTRPTVLPLSIGDGELCDTALTTVSVPDAPSSASPAKDTTKAPYVPSTQNAWLLFPVPPWASIAPPCSALSASALASPRCTG